MAGKLSDDVAAAILSGSVGATLNRGLTWWSRNLRKNDVPTKIEGKGRIECNSLADTFDLIMRLSTDKPWEHTSPRAVRGSVPDETASNESHTTPTGGQPQRESDSPGTWTESGQTPALRQVSK